jgi:hypothetical protein
MPSDISRTSDEQRYDGVVMQQGRVILDRDFNALRQTIDGRIDHDALDFVGPCGTPDDGFEIGAAAAVATSPPAPPLLMLAFVPPRNPTSSSSDNFSISPGTMYVGGQRAVFPPRIPGQGPVDYSYFDQPNWISPDAPIFPLTQEFIYLHLLEHTVSAVEDPELKDVALGGPDTTQRLHLMKRVKRLTVTSADCIAARAQAVGQWLRQGLHFDPQTMRLIPQATLRISYADPTTRANPCDPIAQGGYLGADNQLIRVQISDGGVAGGAPQLLWGTDNASFLYRATISTQTAATLVLGQSPVDAFHIPQQGQVIEVLRSAFVIDTEPNAGDPLQPDIIRCVAETRGFICTLTAPYQPDTRMLSLNQPLPAEYLSDTHPLFVRIWQSQIRAFNPDGNTPYPLQYVDGSQTGVQVTISTAPAGGSLPIGAYWMFAVRPSTPQAVYPERFLVNPQPPDGPRQWICPLATIDWTAQSIASPPTSPLSSGPVFHDCRNLFLSLVELSKRKLGGCCAVTLRPEDLAANPAALQNAADQFRGAAQGMAICLTPGTFALAQPLQLDSRHSGLTIEACHGAVTLQAAPNSAPAQFLQGLIVLAGSNDITLKGLALIPAAVDLFQALPVADGPKENNLRAALPDLGDIHMLIGVRLQDCTGLKVIGCSFQLVPIPHVGNYGAAIFATGDCTGLSVRQCHFVGPGHPRRIFRPLFGLVDAIRETPAANLRTSAADAVNVAPDAAAANAAAAAATVAAAGTGSASAAARARRTRAKSAPAAAAKSASVAAAASPVSPHNSALASEALRDRVSLLNVAQKISAGLVNKADTALKLPLNTLAASPQPPPSMLAAFLLAPSIDPFFNYISPLTLIGGVAPNEAKLLSQAVLDQAEFIENRMQGLTLAVLGAANTGTLTFTNNNLTDCIGGIWYASLNQDIVYDAGVFQGGLGIVVQQGLGAAIAMSAAMWYPLPLGPTSARLSPLSTQIQMLGNRIAALPLDGSFSGPACLLSIAALPVAAFGAAPAADPNTSILLSSNQIRNRSNVGSVANDSSWIFGSTVFLIGAFDTIVAANFIRNGSIPVAGTPGQAYSLLVDISAGGAVNAVGNILGGAHNVGP